MELSEMKREYEAPALSIYPMNPEQVLMAGSLDVIKPDDPNLPAGAPCINGMDDEEDDE